MNHALIVKGAVATYPYSFRQLRLDNPQVSFPADPSPGLLAEWGVVTVAPVDQPSVALDKNAVEGIPALVAGIWTQTWTEEPATADQVAERQREAADTSQRANIKADAFVARFIAMTPAEVLADVNANVTNIATAKTLIGKLAIMVLLLARREFKD